MKRIIFALFMAVSISGFAQFQEHINYEVVAEKASAEPNVTEFFSIYCGHCFQFESLVEDVKAKLKPGTKFEKSHVSYIPRNNPEAQLGMVKAYVIMEEIGYEKGEEIKLYFFNQVHIQNRNIDDVATMKTLFIEKGIAKEAIDRYYADAKITEKAQKMSVLWEEKAITNVPTLLVNGKYKVIMNSVKNMEEMMTLVNYLIDKK
ncbi:MAG: thiol:disulfide interchange protein DsbA [Roseivirga sp.]|jgi:thiol:disulfide interchange protein DsbA